ncbi:hypothetical protein GCM10020254_69540 [Streptomyces goshikiensis]
MGGALGEGDRAEGEGDPDGVGEAVGGVREQCEAAGQHRAEHLEEGDRGADADGPQQPFAVRPAEGSGGRRGCTVVMAHDHHPTTGTGPWAGGTAFSPESAIPLALRGN